MSMMRRIGAVVVSVAAAGGAALGQGGSREISGLESYPERLIPGWVRSFGGIPAFTQPARDATMGFTFSVEVAEVLVKVGDRVRSGDLLVRAWDEAVVAAWEAAQAQAENEAEIKLWEATENLAQIEYDRLLEAQARTQAISPAELEAKKTELEVARRRVENARVQKDLAAIQAKVRRAEMERYRLRAPFDGVVAEVKTEVGAIVRETEPVVRVVNRDTVRIRVDMPEREARRMGLRAGDRAWVVVDDPEEPVVYEGEVVEVSPDVVFGAKVLPLWVEVPNPDGHPTGLSAWVRFAEPTGEWAGRVRGAEEAGTVGEAGR